MSQHAKLELAVIVGCSMTEVVFILMDLLLDDGLPLLLTFDYQVLLSHLGHLLFAFEDHFVALVIVLHKLLGREYSFAPTSLILFTLSFILFLRLVSFQ